MSGKAGSRRSGTVLRQAAWVGAALLIALGAAGAGSAVSPVPAGSYRLELTWEADHAAATRLDAATSDLKALSTDVDSLGKLGRTALGALASSDTAAMATAIQDGTNLVASIRRESDSISNGLAAIAADGDPAERLGATTLARYRQFAAALTATVGLEEMWASFTAASTTAISLTQGLLDHDTITIQAARAGSLGQYAEALQLISKAREALASARKVRDTIAVAGDVETLDLWIARNAALDDALTAVYTAMQVSGGRVTDPVRKAFEAEQAAQKNLPPDTRALVVVMGEVARSGFNQAVIAIEQARGRLNDVVGTVN